jgi:hypothetical protein
MHHNGPGYQQKGFLMSSPRTVITVNLLWLSKIGALISERHDLSRDTGQTLIKADIDGRLCSRADR